MRARVFIPMLDLCFLSLGAIVAILSQTTLLTALPVDVSDVGRGIAAVTREDVTVVVIRDGAIFIDESPVPLDDLAVRIHGLAVIRIDEREPTEALIEVMRGG